MAKKALITGVTGQDGSYLSEFLLEKGYEVYGMVRRNSIIKRERIDHLRGNKRFRLMYGDLCDSSSINNIMQNVMPDEVYNLAAQSHVAISFEIPEYTGDATGLGTTRILDALRMIAQTSGKKIRFYQASTSELYGKVVETPQNENTPFYPRSPYGCAKLYAFWTVKNYRESYGMFAVNGILFNHESPRRGENFVTRKITKGVARIKMGVGSCLELGNLDARRDWGHARDFIKGMWLMLQQDRPDDYVLATGENHSVREFIEAAFSAAGMSVRSNGRKGIKEEYVSTDTGKPVVRINPKYFRPSEVDVLLGDSSKAKKELGWKPRIVFSDLVKEMVGADLEDVEKELYGCNGKK